MSFPRLLECLHSTVAPKLMLRLFSREFFGESYAEPLMMFTMRAVNYGICKVCCSSELSDRLL
jgi:hypothetical protein